MNSRNGYLLSHISSDTFYCFDRNKNIQPFFVRKPSIHKQSIPIFVNAWVETDQYYFLSTVEKKYDPVKDEGLDPVYFMIEKEGQKIYTQKILNKDIEDYTVDLDPRVLERTTDARQGITVLNAEELLDANERGKIKSQKLINHVEKMKEDSNPVLLLMNFL